MCPLTRIQQPQPAISSCFASPLKRTRENGKDARPRKRVTFSPEECVLGRAQDYDRANLGEPSSQRSVMAPRQPSNASFGAHGLRSPERSSPNEQEAAGVAAKGHPNFCGMWRRSQSFNWSALLELSGMPKDAIPEELKKMQASSVVHFIEHDDVTFRLVVNSDSDRTITQDQRFYIGGQQRPNPSCSSSTLASMRWTRNGQALVLTTINAATGDEMTVSRSLTREGAIMVQHYRARCARTGDSAEAVTIFRRI